MNKAGLIRITERRQKNAQQKIAQRFIIIFAPEYNKVRGQSQGKSGKHQSPLYGGVNKEKSPPKLISIL